MNNLATNRETAFDPHTIYKESYVCEYKPPKVLPILPRPNLSLPAMEKQDENTVYKVSIIIF